MIADVPAADCPTCDDFPAYKLPCPRCGPTGALDQPTPPKPDRLTPFEEKLLEVAADVAEVVGKKESGASNP